jgi:electron transport complex protein RnfA
MLISAMMIQNIALVSLIGLEVFILMESKKKQVFMLTTWIIGLSLTTFLLTYPLEIFILKPLDIEMLQPIIFVLILFLSVSFIKKIIGKKKQESIDFLNQYFVYIILNSAFIGISILNANMSTPFIDKIVFIIGTGVGYGFMLFTYIMIKARISAYRIPKILEGLPITFFILGIMAMSLLGLAGII